MIISTERLPEECHTLLNKFGVKDSNLTDSDLREGEVLMTWPSKVAGLLEKMPKLRVLQTFSAGVDDLPFEKLVNVTVMSNAGAYSESVAEHAWALALALAKRVNVRKKVETYSVMGGTAVILGAGGIGSEIARIAKFGFSMKVVGVSRSFKRPEFFDVKLHPTQLREAIPQGDVVFDALPLNKETRGLLNYELLRLMKQRAILVNMGRGETIVEEDIIRILKERPDLRFGTDVFWRRNGRENFDSPLWELENFAGTYHTAGASASGEILRRAMISACANLERYLSREEANNLVRISDYL